MNWKKCSVVIAGFGLVGAATATIGYTFDRPTWFQHEFLPVAQTVQELVIENTASKLQRALEQVQRITKRINASGEDVDSRDVQDLRFWQGRADDLRRKLKKLEK